ncbi:MAG: YlbF family regulator [Lachnospiraceae bacterium]|nr:YlbF family regulator [Lachnospiraceae bacterium]
MEQMKEALEGFMEALKETPDYKNYIREKEKVKAQPKLKEQIDEYRKRNFELQNLTEEENLFERVEQFEREYAQFRENPLVSDFLAAELALCRLIQEVNLEIAAALDFE